MMSFEKHPGLIFVVATFLPLVSFAFLLIINGIRSAFRNSDEKSLGGSVYKALGGDDPKRWPAFVATGAIAAAFVCCLIGFIWFVQDPANQHHEEHADHEKTEHKEGEHKEGEHKEGEHQEGEEEHHDAAHRWSGHFNWITLGADPGDSEPASALQLGYKIDYLSGVMFLMVTFIATLIHVFSMGYMSDELTTEYEDHHVHAAHGHFKRRGRFGRFFLFLSLFCFSMLNLILADNLFQVFLSWELVGVCSFLLIGFYYERKSASNAANKAFIVNRVGDAGFIIGLLVLWTFVGSFNFDTIFSRIRAPERDQHQKLENANQIVRGKMLSEDKDFADFEVQKNGSDVFLFPTNIEDHHLHAAGDEITIEQPREEERLTMPYWMLVVAGLGIFLGCVGKSAQFPLHVWLPDAMEGPTPVSALIHAATMVAAGVYLVGRVFPLFTPEALIVIAYTGGITLFVAATIALVATDIKKVLAYSTVSQLGYMMLALGIGGWVAGLFHLITHAFFKALMFLCSGSVIYGCHHEQEMTKMGGLYPKMKITALTMLMGVLAISGIPAFSGWYSKDAIVASALGFVIVHPQHLLLFLLPLITAGITTFYMFRLWFMTFTGKPRDEHVHEIAHESPRVMTTPLILLAIFSVCVAWGWPFFSSHFPFVDAESSLLEKTIHHAQPAAVEADFGPVAFQMHKYHHFAGNLAFGMVGIGLVFAYLFYYNRALDPNDARRQFPKLHGFLSAKWYFDELYRVIIVRPSMAVANWCSVADKKGIDVVLNNIAYSTVWISFALVGRADKNIIDGLVNVIPRVSYGVGGYLRRSQTGHLRSYIVFLVLGAVGAFALLSYFVAKSAI